MITVTEPQALVLIAVFATAILGMLGWRSIGITRANTAAADRLDADPR